MNSRLPVGEPGTSRKCLRLAAAAAGLLAMASDASALLNDQLELFVSETVARDNNLFRISKDRDPATFLGSSQKNDTYMTTTAGFNVNVPVSRQRFQAGASLSDVRYDHFSRLNYSGHEAHGLWSWQAGSQWNGDLGYQESKTLASFSGFLDFDPQPNMLKSQRLYGTAAYLLTPSWQFQAGLSERTLRNSAQRRRENDADLQNVDLGLNYITAASNKYGVSLRYEDGRLPNRQAVGALLFDNSYSQWSLGAVADWTITGKSHLTARIDSVHRDYDQAPERNYHGTTFRADYLLKATGKLGLTATAYRDISTSESLQTGLVLAKGFALRPTYDLTEKTRLSAIADYSIRDYFGDPRFLTATRETDRVHIVGAAVSYRPLRTLTLQLSGVHEQRTSNVQFADYSSNVVSLSARLAF